MNRYFKMTAALAAFALLLVVMGLSTQPTVQAQTPGPGEPSQSFVCSNSLAGCTLYDRSGDNAADAEEPTTGAPDENSTGDNLFTIAAVTDGEVTIQNLDLPRVTQKVAVADGTALDGPDANPKTIPIAALVTIEAVHKSSGLVDARCDINGESGDGTTDSAYDEGECTTGNAYQVKAFNGNRIQVSYTPDDNTFGSVKTVRVDNGRPSLVSSSPAPGLIVKGNANITFSADITDSVSGFAAKFTGDNGLGANLSDAGILTSDGDPPANNSLTREGGVRLVVAGNVVNLVEGDFTKIDDGWRVSKTLNSTALQAIATNVPWYFEVRDEANNSQRTSGSVSGTAGVGSAAGTIVDSKFSGNLSDNTFLGSRVRVSKKVGTNTFVSNNQSVTFTGSNGTFVVANEITAGETYDPLFDDAVKDVPSDSAAADSTPLIGTGGYQCPVDARDDYTRTAPTAPATVTTATRTKENGEDDEVAADQLTACQPAPKDTYEILGTNLITIDSVNPALASGNPVVTGIGYNATTKADKAQKNSIKVTFADEGKTDSTAPGSGIDADTVTEAAFSVSGHTVESVRTVGNRVYLTLADNLGSTERPWVDIAGSQIRDKAGNAVTAVRTRAVDKLGPNLNLSKSADLSNDKVTVTITTDEQLNATPTVYVTEAAANGDAEAEAEGATARSPVRQTGSMSYTYTHENSDGGEFSVYVKAADTSEVESTAGDSDSAADPGSFTFELDKKLNKGVPPQFDVASVKDVANKSGTADNVEQVDPLIVTVDFTMEGDEYARDSYKTVTLTSAKLSIRLPDGTTEPSTIDLTTGVTTPDNVKFTIPLLNPKIGAYTLTVQAVDQAGNTQIDGSADLKASWDVVKPKPVEIDLSPGWNLISLPFQPANPAINSVIPPTHPVSIVMTFDNVNQTWLFSRRDTETGNFVGDIVAMTASTAYFVRTENFQPLKMLRPALTTSASANIQPPAVTVVEGWNLVPVITISVPAPEGVAADDYFGTLRSGSNAGWLKALTFETLSRVWSSVTPGDTVTVGVDDTNPCTGKKPDAEKVLDGTEPCQMGAYTERDTGDAVKADSTADPVVEADPVGADENDPNKFDDNDRVVLKAPVTVGKGYWLYATADGVLIP
ncbi:MAG: hypothetical protein OXC99_00675 [Chloroflexi bacterium]|nr:hypothetical protein [Chloroflexota bacterium]